MIIVANKQDKVNAISAVEVEEKLIEEM